MKKNSKKKRKKQKEKEQEESGLEEDISEEETKTKIKEITKDNIERKENISDFLLQTEIKAPVLEKIASQGTSISIQRQFNEQPESERKIDYVTSNEPKYTAEKQIQTKQEERKYETTFTPPVLSSKESFENQRDFFIPKEDTWGEEAKQISETPSQFGIKNTNKRKLPFEEEQKKYKKVEF